MQPLLRRLDDLAAHLATCEGAVALLGLGSSGAQLARLDEHSDLDLFVIVDEGAKWRFVDRTDWLEAPAPVIYSFANDRAGRKALYADGILVEYAVFTADELKRVPFTAARVVWRRPDAPRGLTECSAPLPRPPYDSVEFHLGEALTNLYVGLHRELRGERLTASRFIQSHAVDRVISLLRLTEGEVPYRDPFDTARRVEHAYPPDLLPLAEMVPGYTGNVAAARVILEWLSRRHPVDPAIGDAVRELLSRSAD